jgi:hypothetical protein
MTPGQREALEKAGFPAEALEKMSRHGAAKLFAALKKRREKGLCTLKQKRNLERWGLFDDKITFENANRAMGYLSSKNWGRGQEVDRNILRELATGGKVSCSTKSSS